MNSSLKIAVQVCIVLLISFSNTQHVKAHSFPMKNYPLSRSTYQLPTVHSYHLHCQFINGDENKVKLALDFRQRFIQQFNLQNVTACKDLFDDIRLCMFDVEIKPTLTSPFISGNWAAMVPIEKFDETVKWAMHNRGESDILVHPNTGYEVDDHINWSLTAGKPWQINTAAFPN